MKQHNIKANNENDAQTCNIVYYGAGLVGKTTNILRLSDAQTATRIKKSEDGTSINEIMPSASIDCSLASLEQIARSNKVRCFLYTIPSALFYDPLRKNTLQLADGVVFVVDSQVERLEASLESLREFRQYCEELNFDVFSMPFVFQFNKRDLPTAISMDVLKKEFACENKVVFEAVAFKGIGVVESLVSVVKQIRLKRQNDV